MAQHLWIVFTANGHTHYVPYEGICHMHWSAADNMTVIGMMGGGTIDVEGSPEEMFAALEAQLTAYGETFVAVVWPIPPPP